MQSMQSLLRPALMALVLLGCVSLAFGQPKDGKAPKEIVAEKTAAATVAEEATLLTMIQQSGWTGLAFMTVLGLFSLLAVAVVIERLVNLTHNKIIPPPFVEKLRSLVSREEDSVEEYRKLTRETEAPIAGALKAGLLRCGRPVPEVEKSMEDALAREKSVLRGRIRLLSIVGNVAPLVGLLGTIVGMIMAFYNTSRLGQVGGRAEILAEGIYLALLTTAAGLTIAIPALLFAAYFSAKIDKFIRKMDELLIETIPFFDRMEDMHAKQKREAEQLVGVE